MRRHTGILKDVMQQIQVMEDCIDEIAEYMKKEKNVELTAEDKNKLSTFIANVISKSADIAREE